MKKVILKSAKLVNHGLWSTEIEMYKNLKEEVTHVITRRTFESDHITEERDEQFKVFSQAYDYFHYLLREWL